MKKLIRQALASYGYQIHRIPPAAPPTQEGEPAYRENGEIGPANFQDKLDRSARGGPFELPESVAINQTVVELAAGARRIVEIGGGTGKFAYAAAANPDVAVACSEIDAEAHAYAVEHYSRPNIRWINRAATRADGPFDLAVSIEVVEHVNDYRGFLAACAQLAPRAILTTPNRDRSQKQPTSGPPVNPLHVREWDAGEYYWVLRTFYRRVELRAMSNPLVLGSVPIRIGDKLSPLIAICEEPLAG